MVTNPFNVEFRESREFVFVIYHNRNVAKITKDGTMMADAREVARNAQVLETLGMTKAMFLVETQQDLEVVLQWPELARFTRLSLNCYFVLSPRILLTLLEKYHDNLNLTLNLEISGPISMTEDDFSRARELFPNTDKLNLLGRSYER